jgi:hypothetical protein
LVEADFVRAYGLSLTEEFNEGGCRRLWGLVRALPPDSATWRLHPEPEAPKKTPVRDIADFFGRWMK